MYWARILLMISACALALNTPVRADLVASWSFEEETGNAVFDGSGSYNIGFIRGDVERCDGKAGKAVRLKGEKSDNYIEVRDAEELRFKGPFTMEFWWQRDVQNTRQTLFRKQSSLRDDLSSYHAYYSGGNISFSITDRKMISHSVSAKAPADGGWHLYDFVYDAPWLRIYIDKTEAVSKEIGGVQLLTDFDSVLYIGTDIGGYQQTLSGRLDEFRMYDEALKPERMGQEAVPRLSFQDMQPAPESYMHRLLGHFGFRSNRLALTKEGQALAAIVLGKMCTNELQIVPAKELQAYIQKISGARLPIIGDDTPFGGNKILVGESRYTRELGIDAAKMTGDSYVIRSFPGRLALVGHDEKLTVSRPDSYSTQNWSSIMVEGGVKTEKKGTLNAVYAFLQDYCGIRWFMPGDLWEYIPQKRDMEVAELNITGKPYRLQVNDLDREGKWKRFFKLSIAKWSDRNYCGKSAGAFVCDACHTWQNLIPAEKYYDSHPEWFAMKNGKRIKAKSLCVSNKEMWAEALKNLKLIYDQGFEMVALLQSDGYQRCQCPNCEALDEYRDNVGYSVPGKPADRIWIFHDYLAREIQKAYPGQKVIIYSYGPTGELPVKIPKLSDNVRIEMCQTDKASLERWKQYHHPPYSAFIYWFLAEQRNNLPQSYDYIAGELKGLTTYGVDAFWFCGGGARWGLNGPIYYMMTRLMRDPNQDPKAILQEFCGDLFGKAAVPMHSYFTALYRGAQRGRDANDAEQLKNKELVGRGEPVFKGFAARDLYLISYPDEILESCERHLKQVRSLADKPEIKKRVEFFADAFGYIKLTTQGFKRFKECEETDWSKESMLKLIQAVSERNKFIGDLNAKYSSEQLKCFLGGFSMSDAVPFNVLKGVNANDFCFDDKNQVTLSLGNVGSEGIMTALKKAQYKIFPLLNPVVKDPVRFPVVIIPQQIDEGVSLFNQRTSQLRDYVMKGGAVMLTHNAVGFREHKAVFPEIGKGIEQDAATNRVRIATNHVITAGMNAGDGFEHAYCDHIVLQKGPQGTVICTDLQGRPVMVVGSFGKGKVVLNGMIPGYSSVKEGDYNGKEKEPEGGELKILLNAINWLQSK